VKQGPQPTKTQQPFTATRFVASTNTLPTSNAGWPTHRSKKGIGRRTLISYVAGPALAAAKKA